MLTFFERLLPRLKISFRWLIRIVVFFVLTALAVVFIEWKLLPWLAGENWVNRLGIFPKLSDRVTVIERKETVSVSPDENLERLVTEHSSVVVSVMEAPIVLSHSVTASLAETETRAGVLLTNDGLIVTYRAESPIADKERYIVFLGEDQSQEAKVVWYDTLLNLLYLRIERDNTPAVAFTNSDDIKSGRKIAILTRFSGADMNVEPNIIGSVERTFNIASQVMASSEQWEGVFFPGSSVVHSHVGSPAFLMNGELAGILGNSTIDGVHHPFFLPANAIRTSLDRLVNNSLRRPVVGVYYLSLTPALETTLGLSRDRGALIYSPAERTGLSILSGSAADRAGLQFGDIIIAVNGAEINLDLPLSVALGRLSPRDTAILKVIRGGVEREISLSL